MSIATNNTILWSDFQAIYNALNNKRSQFGWGAVNPSGGGGGNTITAATANALIDQINSLKSNATISSQNKLSTYTRETVGALIKPAQYAKAIGEINAICANYNNHSNHVADWYDKGRNGPDGG